MLHCAIDPWIPRLYLISLAERYNYLSGHTDLILINLAKKQLEEDLRNLASYLRTMTNHDQPKLETDMLNINDLFNALYGHGHIVTPHQIRNWDSPGESTPRYADATSSTEP